VKRVLGLNRSAADIASATPAQRDRYLDFLRALSITAVVAGHWLMAVVWLRGGDLRASAVLDMAAQTHWLTWVVQVMPIFFLVGGAVNARSWRATRAAGGSWGAWVARRAARLLRPTTVLVWFWTLLGPLALVSGLDRDLIRLGAGNALVPLWFLAVYLLLIVLVPVLLAAHERFGPALPVLLLAVAAGVDAVDAAGLPHVGLLNYLVVWSVPTVLGFHWIDGTFHRRAMGTGMPLLALGALLAAVTWLGYPVSMVGLAGGEGPNTPSAALALLGCVQAGAAFALRAPLTRWLRRPRPWAAVVRLNLVAMTVYLWHLTVMVLVIGVLPLTGSWWSVAPLSAAWWLTRPLWILGLAVLLTPVVTVFAPVEHTTPRSARARTTPGMVAATAIAAAAIAELTLGGVLGWSSVAAALGFTAAAVHAGAFGGRRGAGPISA
jgi:peptidoglycan/LPS O-acetylase OafA/YrhL